MTRKKKTSPSGGFLDACRGLMKGRPVEFPELGLSVVVRPLTEAAAAELRPRFTRPKPGGKPGDVEVDNDAMVDCLIAACVFAPGGAQAIFTPDDAKALRTDAPNGIYARLNAAVLEANGYKADPPPGNG